MIRTAVKSKKAQVKKGKKIPVTVQKRSPRIRSKERSPAAQRSIRKFLRFFPGGFRDETYNEWERAYKWHAHEQWKGQLGEQVFSWLMKEGRFREIAAKAAAIEGRTNLLFSFEKMALRDAVRTEEGARAFAEGLYRFIYGKGEMEERFDSFAEVLAQLPRKQTRVLTWPMQTVFAFIADPRRHFFVKPVVTRRAAERYGFELNYSARPNWKTYRSILDLAAKERWDLRDLHPRDMIDLQSFIWVLGSEEYE